MTPLMSEERSHHGDHFDVAEPQVFLVAEFLEDPAEQPHRARLERRAGHGLAQARLTRRPKVHAGGFGDKRKDRGRKWHEKRKGETGDQTADGEFVRQQAWCRDR